MKNLVIILSAVLLVCLFAFKKTPADLGIKLPPGFAVQAFAENIGSARHLAVTPQGTVYVKLGELKNGKGIVALTDADKDGKAEKISAFANYEGTGLVVKGDYLYASSDEEIFRYKLAAGVVTNPDSPDRLVTGLLSRGQHASKSITLDNAGNLYTNIGAYSNACQERDRTKGSLGRNPCPILDSAGGVWQFSASQLNQTYGNGKRYATGLRNVVGLDWNTALNQLFVTQHGRDQLSELWPALFDTKQSAELPAETFYGIKAGDNCGWPYVYYDQLQKKKILAPEYGGDGKKTGGEKAIDPLVAFPGHLAPNGLLFYTGKMFPEHYRNGAFIAFHGSWNRAPEPQKGYFVVFVPFKSGSPSGPWEIFADNFAGIPVVTSPEQAQHRPCGLAQGPDGSLYISDDNKGTIYRVTYSGN